MNSSGAQALSSSPHPWNVVFDLLAHDGSLRPSHHTHIPGIGMEEEVKKEGEKGTWRITGRLSEAGR